MDTKKKCIILKFGFQTITKASLETLETHMKISLEKTSKLNTTLKLLLLFAIYWSESMFALNTCLIALQCLSEVKNDCATYFQFYISVSIFRLSCTVWCDDSDLVGSSSSILSRSVWHILSVVSLSSSRWRSSFISFSLSKTLLLSSTSLSTPSSNLPIWPICKWKCE